MKELTRKLSDGRGFPFGMEQDLKTPGFNGGLEAIAPDNIRGIEKKKYSVITLNLTTSRSDEKFRVNGTLIQVVEGYDTSGAAPSATVKISIRFNDLDADAVPMYPGQSIGGLPFDTIYISHDAQADKTITLLCIVDSAKDRVDVE